MALAIVSCGGREIGTSQFDDAGQCVARCISDASVDVTLNDASSDAFSDASPDASCVSDCLDAQTDVQACNMFPVNPVNLGTAGNFAILAKTGIDTVPGSAITGDIGVSPAAATFITGFSLIADPSNVWSTSSQVTGKVFAADYTPPTPANMTTAISDVETAFNDAAGRSACVTELGAGDISGMTLPAGVYKWGTGLLLTSDVTLNGSATDIFIFEIAQNLTIANGVVIHLSGGVLAKNVFWQVSGSVDVGTTAHVEGNVLCMTLIAMHTGSSINGRLLAQSAVTLEQSTVVQP